MNLIRNYSQYQVLYKKSPVFMLQERLDLHVYENIALVHMLNATFMTQNGYHN
jgi:hypothetical protein